MLFFRVMSEFIPTKVEVNLQSQELEMDPNVNRLVHPFRMIISGPTMSGKSHFMYLMLKYRENIFTSKFHRILFCIPPESSHEKMPFYKKMEKEYEHLELVLGLPKEENVLDNALPKLIIIGKTSNNIRSHAICLSLLTLPSHVYLIYILKLFR
jgi:hypothetical protein